MVAESEAETSGSHCIQCAGIAHCAIGTTIKKNGTCQIKIATLTDHFGGARIAARARQITIADSRNAILKKTEQLDRRTAVTK